MRTVAAILTVLVSLLTGSAVTAPDLARLSHWDENSKITVDHSAWAAFLSRYLDTTHPDGVHRVRYGAVSDEDRRGLNAYIRSLSAIDPATLNRNEAFAYWVNLYNAVTVKLIVDHYPVKSIRDIKPSLFSFGPWNMKLVTVAGRKLSLDNIEHDLLRVHWKDPRVHYVVNCASIGCPNLPERPLNGAGLDARLDEAAGEYINHERGARFDERGRLTVSSIYKWYAEDFGGSDEAVLAHLRKYAEPALKQKLREVRNIADYEYDWALNDTPAD